MTATSAPAARTLDVPGACLHLEVRGAGPLLVLVGAPMDADAFAPLADLLATDHTVLTTDPRGVHRSRVEDPERDSPPEVRADDLSRLIAALDVGPAAVLGSSGGAVTALALVQAHPEQVDTVIAHEPPLEELLEERAELRARTQHVVDTYLADGSAAAWREFVAVAGLPLPEHGEANGAPADPPERNARVIADERHFFLRELRATTGFRPDLAALRAASTRIVVGLGEDSGGQLCDRTSRALAAALRTRPTSFPGSHIGFVEDPVRFAARLREVLAAD
jgi:pimeloyl-ACP methyl ester carboxylesterase